MSRFLGKGIYPSALLLIPAIRDKEIKNLIEQVVKDVNILEIEQWVKEKLECRTEDMEGLFRSKTARNFLIVWNIYEIELFNKYCTLALLGDVALKLSRSTRIGDLQGFIEYFHDRYYGDKEKYRHLKNGRKPVEIPDKVVSSSLRRCSIEQKIHFLLFVLFRYRNNMFHGNKGLINWLQYDEQIQSCTKAMCIIVDMYKEINAIETVVEHVNKVQQSTTKLNSEN